MTKTRKPVKLLEITQKQEKYLPEIENLFKRSLGEGFLTQKTLKDMIRSHSAKILGAFVQGEIVGIQTLHILTKKEVEELKNKCFTAGNLSKYPIIGRLTSLAVKETFRKQGIGNLLIKEGLKELRNEGCQYCISTAWDSGVEASSSNLLEKNGFRLCGISKTHWTADSLKKGYSCSKCGPPPCHCSALLYCAEMNINP
jgi:ribosomal protein S18 acetylase RimI-like enzyme